MCKVRVGDKNATHTRMRAGLGMIVNVNIRGTCVCDRDA